MALNTKDREKYINYLKKVGKNIPPQLDEVKIEFSAEQDPIASIVTSLSDSYIKINDVDNLLVEDEINEIKSGIYTYIISESFKNILDKEDNFFNDSAFLSEARKIDTIEDLTLFVMEAAMEDDKVKVEFLRGLFIGYYNYADSKRLPTDSAYKEFVESK